MKFWTFLLPLFTALVFVSPATAENWQSVSTETLSQVWLPENLQSQPSGAIFVDTIGVWTYGEADETTSSILRQSTHTAFQEALELAGIEVVDSPDSATLHLRVQLVDLRFSDTAHFDRAVAERYRFPLARGHITLVAELVRSDGSPILRVADLDNLAPDTEIDTALAATGWAPAFATLVETSQSPEMNLAQLTAALSPVRESGR